MTQSVHDDTEDQLQALELAQRREAELLYRSGVDTRMLVARSIVRCEYAIRIAQATRATTLENAEQLGLVAADAAHVRAILGDGPDPQARPPRAGSGLALQVSTLWSERRGAALGALVGGGGAIRLVELARVILEVLR